MLWLAARMVGLEEGADGGKIGLGKRALLHFAIDGDMNGFGVGQEFRRAVARSKEAVGKLDDRGAQAGDAGFDGDEVVVSGRRFVAAGGLDNGEVAVVLQLHVSVIEAELAKELDAADFAPDEVIRVVGHAHLVGFRVANAQRGSRWWHERSVQRAGDRVQRVVHITRDAGTQEAEDGRVETERKTQEAERRTQNTGHRRQDALGRRRRTEMGGDITQVTDAVGFQLPIVCREESATCYGVNLAGE